MANEPIPNDPSDDELESLAQDLFGVSLNEQQELEPFDVGEFDLDEVAPATDEASATENGPQAQSDPADDGFGASLLDQENATPTSPASQRAEPVSSLDEPAEDPDASDGDGPTEARGAGQPDDDYWDALDGFDWNEEGDSSQSKSQMRKEYVEATDSFEDLSIESADKTDEFLDDADFGAGLDDEEADAMAVPSQVKEDAKSDTDADRKGRRRRGRRRRGPAKDTAEEGRSSAPASGAEQQPSDKAEERSADVDQADTGSSDDGFGAGLEIEDPDGEQTAKRRRRRGGRRRGRRKPSDDTVAVDLPEADSPADDRRDSAAQQSDSTSERSKEGKYRSVPTWEEAISYLVRPKPPKSGNGGSSGSGSRRGSRRGSGRRRRS